MIRYSLFGILMLMSVWLAAQEELGTNHSLKFSVHAPMDTNHYIEDRYSVHGMGLGVTYNYQYFFKGLPFGINIGGQLVRSEVPTPTASFEISGNPNAIVAHPAGSIYSGALYAGLFMHAQKDPESIAFQPSISLGYGCATLTTRNSRGIKTPSTTLMPGTLASNYCLLTRADFLIPVNKKVHISIGGQLSLMSFTFEGIRSNLPSETINYHNWSLSVGFLSLLGE